MVTARRIAAHAGDTPANVPIPMTLTCKVINDFANRTLFVRLPDTAGGTQRVAWRRAQQALVQAENEGYQSQRGAPQLWARGVGAGDRIAYGTPGDAWDTLKFFFPRPTLPRLIRS